MLSKFKKLAPRFINIVKQNKATFTTLGTQNLSKLNVAPRIPLANIGDLPFGQIPDALRYDHPIQESHLPNGIQVVTDSYPSPLSTITVFIKCGSRDETPKSSGVAHFLEHLHFKGTKNRTRHQLELDVENMGGQLNAYTSREVTSYTMTVFKNDAEKGIEILGDMLCNSNYDKYHLENERRTIHQELIETQKDFVEASLEHVHYNAFPTHMVGYPILGSQENIGTISRDQIVDYHRTHYVGSNMIIVGAGNLTHEQLVEWSEKYFGALKKETPAGCSKINTDIPHFASSLMLLPDPEKPECNVSVFYQAPGWNNEDYYAFLVLQRVLDELNPSSGPSFTTNFYDTSRNLFKNLPEISVHKSLYVPYSDFGIYGSTFQGSEENLYEMLYALPIFISNFSNYINPVEVSRARNKLYSVLLQMETGVDITQSIGNQILLLNRIVPRSEMATRLANIDADHLSHIVRKWLAGKDPSTLVWGPADIRSKLRQLKISSNKNNLAWKNSL